MKLLLMLFATALAAGAHANVVTPMEFSTQQTILTSGADITSCGIRFVGTKVTRDDKHVDLVDGSIMFNEKFVYLVKAGHFRTEVSTRKQRPKAGDVAWIKIGKSANIVPKSPLIQGETEGYKLFMADLDPGTLALEGIYAKDRLWVAFRDSKQLVAVYSGALKIDEETMDQFAACMSGLTDRLDREMKSEPEGAKKP